jgi:hypothetical protein
MGEVGISLISESRVGFGFGFGFHFFFSILECLDRGRAGIALVFCFIGLDGINGWLRYQNLFTGILRR